MINSDGTQMGDVLDFARRLGDLLDVPLLAVAPQQQYPHAPEFYYCFCRALSALSGAVLSKRSSSTTLRHWPMAATPTAALRWLAGSLSATVIVRISSPHRFGTGRRAQSAAGCLSAGDVQEHAPRVVDHGQGGS